MIKSPFEMASQFVGLSEINGVLNNPMILAMLRLDTSWPENDETPWCAAFMNFICHSCKTLRTKSLRARSWLAIGEAISLEDAKVGFDVVILERGAGGHVGFYVNHNADYVRLLGGNQGNKVSIASYPRERILGVRRLE